MATAFVKEVNVARVISRCFVWLTLACGKGKANTTNSRRNAFSDMELLEFSYPDLCGNFFEAIQKRYLKGVYMIITVAERDNRRELFGGNMQKV